jgi:hypothetical protein
MAKAVVIASAAFSALLGVVPVAPGARNPPPNPAIAQYVEVVPTSSGSAVPSGHARTRLSEHVVQRLPKTNEGTTLRNVATEATYGAPQHKLHATRHASKRVAVEVRRAVMAPKADVSTATFGAAVDAVGARRGLVPWLGIVLLATAAFGAGAAIARARR